MELLSDFKAFLSSIEPGSADVTAAKAAHEKVRDELRTDSESKEAHKETFLSGSYARSTAIKDINDVDVICLLDIDTVTTAPELVLSWLQGILSKYYKETRPQGRSVGAKAANDVWLDIVPGVPIGTDDGPVKIPDREAQSWVASHPKGQIAAAISQNKATDGLYVPVVKITKAWRDRLSPESARPKSYILETLVHKMIGHPTTYAGAVVSVLEGIEEKYGAFRGSNTVPFISDPGYASVNVAKRWTSSEFDAFMWQVKVAATVARKAFDSTDEKQSRALWQQLLGPAFGSG